MGALGFDWYNNWPHLILLLPTAKIRKHWGSREYHLCQDIVSVRKMNLSIRLSKRGDLLLSLFLSLSGAFFFGKHLQLILYDCVEILS